MASPFVTIAPWKDIIQINGVFMTRCFKWFLPHNRLLPAALLGLFILTMPACTSINQEKSGRVSVTDFGAVGDGTTLDTKSIQSAIDHLAANGGGTLVIPKGVFLSGALFLKPGVDLYLDEGAVLKGSTNIADFPKMKTRIEGQFIDWIPALVNADHCDHLRITGSGTLDGDGHSYYVAFWHARRKNADVTNLAVERPRLMFLEESRDVQVRGVTFKDSGFWNLHLYKCVNVAVSDVHFEAPYQKGTVPGPSTDGMDIDSCQRVNVRGCSFAVNDDCIGLKGTKGPFALQDKDSPPIEHIRVSDCTFVAGQGVVTLGSEATVVNDVIVENCTVTGKIPLVRFKLRPDTPQLYENIQYRNITLTGTEDVFEDEIIAIKPWTQFFDLKGATPPKSVVKDITLSNIHGTFGKFGEIVGAAGQTDISNIRLENIHVNLKDPNLYEHDVKNLVVKDVTVNGKPFVIKDGIAKK
jgi:alpha-L-rhamnosidase